MAFRELNFEEKNVINEVNPRATLMNVAGGSSATAPINNLDSISSSGLERSEIVMLIIGLIIVVIFTSLLQVILIHQ